MSEYKNSATFDLGSQCSMRWEFDHEGATAGGELEAYGPAFVVLRIGAARVELRLDYDRPEQSVTVLTDAKLVIEEGPDKLVFDD